MAAQLTTQAIKIGRCVLWHPVGGCAVWADQTTAKTTEATKGPIIFDDEEQATEYVDALKVLVTGYRPKTVDRDYIDTVIAFHGGRFWTASRLDEGFPPIVMTMHVVKDQATR